MDTRVYAQMDEKAQAIERLRERIAAGGGKHYYQAKEYDNQEISAPDGDRLLEFSDRLYLLRSDYSDDRHQKLLNSLVLMAEHVGGVADAVEDRQVAEDLVRWIHKTYPNEETNRDYRIALRVFGQRLDTDGLETDRNGIPLALSWIPSTTSSTYDPSPEPSKMLRWEDEVQSMPAATLNDRDSALIALAFDAGPRGGELYDLRVGDITWYVPEDDDDGEADPRMQVTVRGKRGKRTVDVIPCQSHVESWLGAHPAADDPAAPLWSHLNTAEQISYRMFLNAFKDAADRAGVTKSVTPTNFRKSSAAHLASNGMNQAHLEDHHGWVRGSKAAARYISVFSDHASRELERIYGEASDPPAPDPSPATVDRQPKPASEGTGADAVRVNLDDATGDALEIVIRLPNRGGGQPTARRSERSLD